MDKCLGFGGLGDCFIVILKLLEYNKPLIYTHVDNNNDRLNLSMELLGMFEIKHDCYVVNDIRQWWHANYTQFDKCFNVFARGFIDIPRRPYHWDPCNDEGYANAFNPDIPEKEGYVAVQVNSGGQRSYKHKPVVQYVSNNYDKDKVLWFGTDKEFNPGFGTNYCGKIDFIEALQKIKKCKYFVGFNSVLLYWSLWNKSECYLFTDHQGHYDLRIHDEWKKYITYDV